ncbi:hypothetical protein [Metabacillus idriensis]|uniref:hypothetical protein n=1 Tax=Metabacillus idriensis TaxID=324768 RepID=UPI00174C3ECF|nr:hypothetical protein [Metabacillus idriensis]
MTHSEPRYIWIAIALLLVISSFFVVLIVPYTLHNILFYTANTAMIQTPKLVLYMYGISMGIMAIACFVMYLNQKKLWKFALPLFIVGIAGIALGTDHYKVVTYDEIKFSKPWSFTEESYKWDEVEQIITEKSEDKSVRWQVKMFFKDGEELVLVRDRNFNNSHSNFYSAAKINEVPYKGIND